MQIARREMNGSDFKCLIVDREMDLGPGLPLAAVMLAGVLLAVGLNLGPGALRCAVPIGIRTCSGLLELRYGTGTARVF
ncbi:hypothetical protein GCM10022290_38340 [Sagittula marina]